MKKYLLPITEDKQPVEFADEQWKIFWSWKEPKVEKDIQDILVNFTESERHAVITTLRLFSLYETHAGDEFWLGRFRDIFDGNEYHRMASVFGAFELAVHAPFYNRINELLRINTPEFFLSYQDDPVLKSRIDHIASLINHPNDFVALAAFSMVEGVVLYSSFAFLKHYQSEGKNKLMHVNRGINFSLRDENLHNVAGSWCFRRLLELRPQTPEQLEEITKLIQEAAKTLLEHEIQIIKKTFEKGKIPGITEHQLENFAMGRINDCMKLLGLPKMYEVKYNPISEWFFKGINNYSYNDFFSGLGSAYNRDWDEEEFEWKVKNE